VFCLRRVGFYIATYYYTTSTLQVYTAFTCFMCTYLSVYFYIVVYTSTLLVFTLLWKSSPFPSEIPSLSLSLPAYKGLPAGSVTFQQLNTFPGFFCDDWRRQSGLFALLLFGRTDVQADGWMDLWVSKRKLTPFNKFIYFCVYGIDRGELIRSSTGRRSTARNFQRNSPAAKELLRHWVTD
jgi:hypothetical protein